MRDRARVIGVLGCALTVLALTIALGAANPPIRRQVSTDRLGPENGEPVAQYLDRAAATLDGTDPSAHWALVVLDRELSAADAYRRAEGVRISQVHFRVPIDRVQTPLVVVGVAGGEEEVARAPRVAAGMLQRTTDPAEPRMDRPGRIDAVSASRLVDGCACVVALTVRGDRERLRAVAAEPGIRAVEVLPADAVFGRFGVRSLLPEHTDAVTPGPDDGAVPTR